MNIGILGLGNVGRILGEDFVRAGHSVLFGVRDPNSKKKLDEARRIGGTVVSIEEATAKSEIIVIALPWPATLPVLRMLPTLKDKIVLDCTNPLKSDLSGLELGQTTSGLEEIQKVLKSCFVYKAFNHTGADNMANPQFGDRKAVMFICGDNSMHKPTVLKLVRETGFEVVDAGGAVAARYLEPLAMLWIHLSLKVGLGRTFAFGLLKR